MAARCVYLTGATASYFLLTLPLLESFAKQAQPDEKLYVCDFGLSEPQKRFLQHKGQLLPRPAALDPGLHPYRYKASMSLFAGDLEYDALVWIDSDCLVVGSFTRAVAEIIDARKDGNDFLAICQDLGGTIADMVQSLPLGPFERLLEKTAISRDNPYLNCAVFILKSHATLKAWRERVVDLEEHPLFEQNLLNVLAYSELKQIELLDREVWNVHDLDLDRLVVREERKEQRSTVLLDDKVVLVVHATSYGGRTVSFRPVRFPIGDGYIIDGLFRMVKNIPVRDLFLTSLSWYLVNNKQALIESGVANHLNS
ncbi:MAG: hypothetical protein HQL81_16270 [Magnetococcales bacterium]|nr:hypothetical protein [Magnetococcales bacterium]